VELVPFDSGFADLARGWRNKYEIYRWCRQHKFITDINQRDWFQRQAADPTIEHWGIVCGNEKMAACGVAGLTSIDLINRRAEFSLYIAPEFQKFGVGKSALTLLLDRAFYDFNLHLVWGESFENNPAHHLFEKVGMKHEATLRDRYFKEGIFISASIFSITQKEWKLRAALRKVGDK
jgi:RimJ/RimL family protein N-acetyltransferase